MKYFQKFIVTSLILIVCGCSEYQAEREIKANGFKLTHESLNMAISLKRYDIVNLYIKAKFNLNPESGQTPVSRAVAGLNIEMTKLLLEAGALPQRNGIVEELYAVDSAVSSCNAEILKLLIDHGASLEVGFPNKKYFLEKRIYEGKYQCSKVLEIIEKSSKL